MEEHEELESARRTPMQGAADRSATTCGPNPRNAPASEEEEDDEHEKVGPAVCEEAGPVEEAVANGLLRDDSSRSSVFHRTTISV